MKNYLSNNQLLINKQLFYVGAGRSETSGGINDLEVWNLFYEGSCTPSAFRAEISDNGTTNGQEMKQVLLPFPNPFQNELHVVNVDGFTEYVLFDAKGQKVAFAALKNGVNTLETESLKTGVYLLMLQNEQGKTNSQRVVKE